MFSSDFTIRRFLRQQRLNDVLSKETMDLSLRSAVSLKLRMIEAEMSCCALEQKEPKKFDMNNQKLVSFMITLIQEASKKVTELFAETDKTVAALQQCRTEDIISAAKEKFITLTREIVPYEEIAHITKRNVQAYLKQLTEGKEILENFARYLNLLVGPIRILQYKPRQISDWYRKWILQDTKKKRKQEDEEEYQKFLEYRRKQKEKEKGRLGYGKIQDFKFLSTKAQELGKSMEELSVYEIKFNDIIAQLNKLYQDYFALDGPLKKAADQLLKIYGVGSGDAKLIQNRREHIGIISRLFGDLGQAGPLVSALRDAYID